MRFHNPTSILLMTMAVGVVHGQTKEDLTTFRFGEDGVDPQCACVTGTKIEPYRYDSLNGFYSPPALYHDRNYDGVGDVLVGHTPLSSGIGTLSDGTVDLEGQNEADEPLYVGYLVKESNGFEDGDVVGQTWFFEDAGCQEQIELLTLYVSDRGPGDGTIGEAGVCTPTAVRVNGVEYDISTAITSIDEALRVQVILEEPIDPSPVLYLEIIQGRSPTAPFTNCDFLFVSEIEFNQCEARPEACDEDGLFGASKGAPKTPKGCAEDELPPMFCGADGRRGRRTKSGRRTKARSGRKSNLVFDKPSLRRDAAF